MSESFLSVQQIGDMVVRYPQDGRTGCVGLEIIPAAMLTQVVVRRETLRGLPFIDALPVGDPWSASVVESLVQFKLAGEAYTPGFAQGHTMRQSGSVARFGKAEQEVRTAEEERAEHCPPHEPERRSPTRRESEEPDQRAGSESGAPLQVEGIEARNSILVASHPSPLVPLAVEGRGEPEYGPIRSGTVVVTKLARADGCMVKHRLSHREGGGGFEVNSSFTNGSDKPVTLEMLSSFSLSGITPFASDDAPGRLRVHRFRSGWSAEGRLETRSIEELHLERSWSGAGAFSERFGQVGTMPVRRWFPFVAVEDTVAGVVWGAQLAWSGSWQMEIFRQHDDVCLSGGLADRELGHWTKTIQPGETFVAPPAVVSCVRGSLDDLCDRFTAMQERALENLPEVEQELPIIFNEWCTTWGDPSHENICAIADRLKGTDARYLVIDAGWYKSEDTDWSSGHGDWVPSRKLFPNGLENTARAIRGRGLIPGLWFEMETVGSQSSAFSLVDHLLKRDGLPVTVRERRFWDLNDPWAVDYLTKRVIDLLERCGFGYLKVDYNETGGIGFDDRDSLGEGLRKQIDGQYRFFDRIRERLPNLVIENCSSGGHRLELSMLARTAMSSFSDAHELVEIPIIAANLHRLLLPRQSQVWAVLHRGDDERRLVYSLAATFLGRMCLSGEITMLDPGQWRIVDKAMRLYRRVAPIIKQGRTRRFGEMGESWRHPRGWQGVTRISSDRRQMLLVVHTFAAPPECVKVPLVEPGVSWTVKDSLVCGGGFRLDFGEGFIRAFPDGPFTGGAWLFERNSGV